MTEQVQVLTSGTAQGLENEIYIALNDGYHVKYESYRVTATPVGQSAVINYVYSVLVRK